MRNIFTTLILFLIFFAGCSSSSVYVDISYQRYKPQFVTEKYSAYKNKRIFISSFTNDAVNTSVFYYFSPDNEVKYGQYAITSYYWYCFEKAFNNIGMVVYKDSAPSDIPEFLFGFDFLTDQKINYEVIVNKRGREVYRKKSAVTLPLPESKDVKYLERRAYEMVDRIIVDVLDDKDLVTIL